MAFGETKSKRQAASEAKADAGTDGECPVAKVARPLLPGDENFEEPLV